MDATAKVVFGSFLAAPCWTLFETLISAAAEKYLKSGDGSDAPKKRAGALTTGCSHLVQLVMWWVVVINGGLTSWAFDVRRWAELMLPNPQNTVERDIVSPAYMIYFGYTWHSLVKDLRRSWPPKSPDQLSFLVHHFLTVGLTGFAYKVSIWRPGVLTRLIHDPADIPMYFGKFYMTYYNEGRGSKVTQSFVYILNIICWFGTRVILYGWLVITLYGTANLILFDASRGYDEFTKTVCVVLFAGCIIMWLLQVIWFYHIVRATHKFMKSGGKDTHDHLDVGQPDSKKSTSKPHSN